MNIVLVGYRGTGKSAVAAILGGGLGRPVVSTDRLAEERIGDSIASFVRQNGWSRFREVESSVVRELAGRDGLVIDTGGGAILDPASRAALRANARVIWLMASPKTIAMRIADDPSRPPLRPGSTCEQEVAEVLAEREPLYRAIADHEVESDAQTPTEVAATIATLLARDLS